MGTSFPRQCGEVPVGELVIAVAATQVGYLLGSLVAVQRVVAS